MRWEAQPTTLRYGSSVDNTNTLEMNMLLCPARGWAFFRCLMWYSRHRWQFTPPMLFSTSLTAATHHPVRPDSSSDARITLGQRHSRP
jgi:hypothetical protein